MSELINNARRRKDLMKHMILQLHEGVAPEAVRPRLIQLLGSVPYGEVVEVEQELIAEGLPVTEVLKLCDVHTAALQGAISQEGAKTAPEGHPVHTFRQENLALVREADPLADLFARLAALPPGGAFLLVTPFVPSPLVGQAQGKGFQAWTDASDGTAVQTWFTRQG